MKTGESPTKSMKLCISWICFGYIFTLFFLLYRKWIEKNKWYSLEWSQSSFLEIQKMHFAAHNSMWEMIYKIVEAEKISQKTEHVPRFQQYFAYLEDGT